MKKLLKKIYWYLWFQVYKRRTTWGVQWYQEGRWVINNQIIDKVFFRKSSAEKEWDRIKDKVKKDQIGALWLIEKADYKKVLDSVNY